MKKNIFVYTCIQIHMWVVVIYVFDCYQEENERDEDETSADMDRHMIASMFLTATSGSMSLTSDMTHNMEQSTFNLGDLCPSRPGVGHSLRPGAGHSLPDESQCHDSLNQVGH